jgi:glycosyltransferase involved in cell wall biosynthesis
MNIAFDIAFKQSASKDRGIGRYSQNMINGIMNVNQENQYYFFSPDYVRTQMELKDRIQRFIAHYKIDIFQITSPFDYFFPLDREWFGDTRVGVIFYDAIPLIYPEVYLPSPMLEKRYKNMLEFIATCDIIYAISETTKKDGIHYGGMDEKKIKVIYGGLDPEFKMIHPNPFPKVAHKFKISKPYVLYTGGTDFRKNIPRLIEAFSYANSDLDYKFELVITGTFSPATLSMFNVKNIIFTGYVSNEDLVDLYNGATLFAFPSLYEGLGLPVLESMACGTPVLTSNTSSLAEIGKDAAYLVDPYSIDQIARGMAYLLRNVDILEELKKRGLNRVKSFQWDKVGRRILEEYK